jgi:tetratricopeptide (TPR) repeat protein
MSATYRMVLARLFQGKIPGRAPPSLPAEQARYRIYDAVREFLVGCACLGPLVLLLDDVEWADEPSLRLLRHLLSFIEEQPILVAIAYDDRIPNSSHLTTNPPVTGRRLHREHIFLSGLSPRDISEILQGRGVAAPAAGPLTQLHRTTGGNPLHLHMLCELLGRCLEIDERLIEELALAAPGVERAAALLINRLDPEARPVLAACAVFPDTFTAADSAALSGWRETDAAALFKGEAGPLVECVNSGARLYRLRHPSLRQALSAGADPVGHMRMMRRALERARRTRSSPWQVAAWHHACRLLPNADAGLATCLATARSAEEESAPEMKVVALRMARDMAPAAKWHARVSILRDLGLAAAQAGAFAEAASTYDEAVAILDGHPRTGAQACDLLVEAATALHDVGAEERLWVRLQTSAYRRLGKRRDLRWARLRLLEPGRMKKISGPPLQVGRWIGLDFDAVRIARRGGDDTDYRRTLLVYEWLTTEDVDQLLARARRWKSPLTRGHALSVAAETLMYRHGRFERACELLEEQLALHAARGSIVEQAKSLVRLTMALLAAGRIEAAVSARTKAREMVARLGPSYLIYEHAGTTRGGDLYPEISMESNFAWYLEGDWQAVAEHWAKAVALEEPGGSPVHIVESAMAAQAFARLGRFAEAGTYLDALTPALKRLQPRDWAFNGAVGRASHAIWDIGGRDYAATYRGLALRLISAGVGDWTNTSLNLTVARMAALLGDYAQAKEYFQKARLELGEGRRDPRRAIVDYDEAVALRLMGIQDRRRGRLLKEAIATFRLRGMRGWVGRAKAEGERLLGSSA